MKKLIKLSLLAIFLGIHPTGCYNKSCDDFSTYYISGIEVETKNAYNLNEIPIHHSPFVDTTKYYQIDSVAFLLSFNHFEVGVSTKKSFFNGFQSTAFACEPSYRYQNPIENVQTFYAGEHINFNDTLSLKTGDNITSMFNISNTFGYLNSSKPLQNFTGQYQNVDESFFLTLARSNKDSLEFNFDLITTLTDGKIFTMEDLTVKLLPSK